MHEIFYAGTVLVTGDDITDALLDAALRVCNSGRAEKVEVPCRSIDGVIADENSAIAAIVLVPNVAILAVRLTGEHPDLVDPPAADRLRGSTENDLALSHPTPVSLLDIEASYDFDEWI